MASEYSEKLKDPRWQRKRLEILERDEWMCQNCFDSESTLVVHHRDYLPGKDPWDYPDYYFITLCEDCHENEKINLHNTENSLLKILRSKFLAEDIHSIMLGFGKMELHYSHELVASVYEWALSSPEIQSELYDRYFAHLKEVNRAKR